MSLLKAVSRGAGAFVILVGAVASANAGTIYSSYVIPSYAAGSPVDATHARYQGWSQTGSYENVIVSAVLFGSSHAWLTDHVGPGTTGGNVLASADFSFGMSDLGLKTVFSGLTLGPGTYYLVVGGSGDGLWAGTGMSSTRDTGVTPTFPGACNTTDAICNFDFVPGGDFFEGVSQVGFDVTGDVATGAPEPSSIGLAVLAILGLGLKLATRKSDQPAQSNSAV